MTDATVSPQVRVTDRHFVLPGLATAHSHAFQRALRGRTQRRAAAAGSFWSWRGLMYHLAERLDPERIYALSHFAYVELAMSGVTAVGEFHYVHHAPDGRPYADRVAMADAVIRAAKDSGVRVTLIRTAYLRAGFGQELVPAQRRFVDLDIAPVMDDVDALRARYAGDPLVRVGVAAHSIRAVPLADVVALADFAAARGLPFHMHVAEQRRELDECRAEYGLTPVALLADGGVLSPNFVGVHATHLTADEVMRLGQSGATVCLCRTTERDLGDGLPRTGELAAAGVRLCAGVDSHCAPDAFEELRAVELDER
ncbi:MAG: formimidoylglutamate deiminase, partial [Caldilineaceae bacterium]|nr:formimidoylglutamate deiminase [Caldilineaceae bacterium]